MMSRVAGPLQPSSIVPFPTVVSNHARYTFGILSPETVSAHRNNATPVLKGEYLDSLKVDYGRVFLRPGSAY
jgi:hypothetical protein